MVTVKRKIKKAATLKTLFEAKQQSMLMDLGAVRKSITHAPTMGNASQKKWRDFLSGYLPSRYKIDEAHVIDSMGKISEQIDLVIYDRQYASLAFNQDGVLYIPAESVYAVCEIKQNISKKNLEYAGKKIESVRKLKRTSAAIPQMSGVEVRKELKPILGFFIALESDYKPSYGVPFLKNLKSLNKSKKIDLIFSLRDGLYKGKQHSNLGLVEFLYSLLNLLQKMGNAPAIDFDSYIKEIEKKHK